MNEDRIHDRIPQSKAGQLSSTGRHYNKNKLVHNSCRVNRNRQFDTSRVYLLMIRHRDNLTRVYHNYILLKFCHTIDS